LLIVCYQLLLSKTSKSNMGLLAVGGTGWEADGRERIAASLLPIEGLPFSF
jgi:hypothetical protein